MENQEEMEKWVVIDGTGLLHRAHHAFKERYAPEGHPTGCMYGTLHFVGKYLKAIGDVDHAICVFDPPGGSLERLALYPDYKAQRPSRAEEISKQEPWVKAFLKASGIPVITEMGHESDDVMATIAKKESTDKKIAILSADKDMGQEVKGYTFWFRPDNSESGVTRMTNRLIFEKFGVRPSQLRDYLVLLGDTSDNLIGVKKVGEVTAAKLLNAFGSIDEMYKVVTPDDAGKSALEAAVGSRTAKQIWTPLIEAKEWLPLMTNLVSLRTELPISRETYAQKEPVNDQMMEDLRQEHGLPPTMGYFLPWQQERAIAMNQAKKHNGPRM